MEKREKDSTLLEPEEVERKALIEKIMAIVEQINDIKTLEKIYWYAVRMAAREK